MAAASRIGCASSREVASNRSAQRLAADFVVGLRISGEELDADGLNGDGGGRSTACKALEGRSRLFQRRSPARRRRLPAPSTSCRRWSIDNAYAAPFAAALKAGRSASRSSSPAASTSRRSPRRSSPQAQADMCGMTRAMICDPEMPNKAKAGRLDDIRACIACNQACIGHFHKGYPISCIQHPETRARADYGESSPGRGSASACWSRAAVRPA